MSRKFSTLKGRSYTRSWEIIAPRNGKLPDVTIALTEEQKSTVIFEINTRLKRFSQQELNSDEIKIIEKTVIESLRKQTNSAHNKYSIEKIGRQVEIVDDKIFFKKTKSTPQISQKWEEISREGIITETIQNSDNLIFSIEKVVLGGNANNIEENLRVLLRDFFKVPLEGSAYIGNLDDAITRSKDPSTIAKILLERLGKERISFLLDGGDIVAAQCEEDKSKELDFVNKKIPHLSILSSTTKYEFTKYIERLRKSARIPEVVVFAPGSDNVSEGMAQLHDFVRTSEALGILNRALALNDIEALTYIYGKEDAKKRYEEFEKTLPQRKKKNNKASVLPDDVQEYLLQRFHGLGFTDILLTLGKAGAISSSLHNDKKEIVIRNYYAKKIDKKKLKVNGGGDSTFSTWCCTRFLLPDQNEFHQKDLGNLLAQEIAAYVVSHEDSNLKNITKHDIKNVLYKTKIDLKKWRLTRGQNHAQELRKIRKRLLSPRLEIYSPTQGTAEDFIGSIDFTDIDNKNRRIIIKKYSKAFSNSESLRQHKIPSKDFMYTIETDPDNNERLLLVSRLETDRQKIKEFKESNGGERLKLKKALLNSGVLLRVKLESHQTGGTAHNVTQSMRTITEALGYDFDEKVFANIPNIPHKAKSLESIHALYKRLSQSHRVSIRLRDDLTHFISIENQLPRVSFPEDDIIRPAETLIAIHINNNELPHILQRLERDKPHEYMLIPGGQGIASDALQHKTIIMGGDTGKTKRSIAIRMNDLNNLVKGINPIKTLLSDFQWNEVLITGNSLDKHFPNETVSANGEDISQNDIDRAGVNSTQMAADITFTKLFSLIELNILYEKIAEKSGYIYKDIENQKENAKISLDIALALGNRVALTTKTALERGDHEFIRGAIIESLQKNGKITSWEREENNAA